MSQEYTPVEWVDDSTIINANRLDRMQTAHHYADGFREVDTVPTEDPEVDYHMIVYCTADSTFYRWNGEAWTKDVDDDTKALLLAHEADHANPHEVTKAQVGLGNVDNTSDADKPVSTAVQNALGLKADASDLSALETVVSGKYTKPAGGIPASDLSSDVQTSLGKADTALQAHQSIKTINSESMVGSGNISLQTPLTAGTDYVVPVAGKGLSANDYTDADKAKLAGIASGAEVNVQANWTQADSTKDDFIKNKPTLATVATSGSYNDLSNKPTIPSVPVQDVTVNGTSVLDGTTAKVVVPAIPDLSLVTSGSGSFVTGLSVSGHQITQTLGTPAVATVDWSEIENKPTFATVATSGSYSDLTDKPSIPSTAADVGALPSTTLYAGSSTAGGAATSALKATADGNGNNIVNTYATKTEVSAKADDSDVVHYHGNEVISGVKTWLNAQNYSAKATMSAGLDITGTLNVNGDINQNGSAYETHAQQVYTADDYIIMRDGAVAGLGAGDYAGFQVKKYDGTNDGRLVIDKDGTARVGDVGDEQPLATRDESASMTGGDLVEWDSANQKMVSSGISADAVAKMHIVLTSQSVTFSLQSTPDYASWPYRADIANADTTANTFATVVFDATQATSGNYAPFCETANGHIYIYAKAAVGTVTIPTIHLSN